MTTDANTDVGPGSPDASSALHPSAKRVADWAGERGVELQIRGYPKNRIDTSALAALAGRHVFPISPAALATLTGATEASFTISPDSRSTP